MTQLAVSSQVPIRLDLGDAFRLSDDELLALSARNPDLRIERTAEGDLVITSPTGARTGRRNALITAALTMWAERDGSGLTFDSSTGIRLHSGPALSPDAAWVLRDRFDALLAEAQEGFLQLAPDFVIELKSAADELHKALEKMEDWRANGVLR